MTLRQRALASRPAQAVLERARLQILRWMSGDIVHSAPGPPLVYAEQPTFAPMRVHHALGDPPVHIGRYCSIHETVTLVTGSEHPLDAVSTYLFYWKLGVGTPEEIGSRGPIVIGNDVWIARDALIMSGVRIGDGAVVAARAVVTRNVEPYQVVGGVPARHLRWRFDEATRQALLDLAWWDWPLEKVLAHQSQIEARDAPGFLARHRPGGILACEVCATAREDPAPAAHAR